MTPFYHRLLFISASSFSWKQVRCPALLWLPEDVFRISVSSWKCSMTRPHWQLCHCWSSVTLSLQHTCCYSFLHAYSDVFHSFTVQYSCPAICLWLGRKHQPLPPFPGNRCSVAIDRKLLAVTLEYTSSRVCLQFCMWQKTRAAEPGWMQRVGASWAMPSGAPFPLLPPRGAAAASAPEADQSCVSRHRVGVSHEQRWA